MAVKEVRICDVFGTAKNVKEYFLTLREIDDEGNDVGEVCTGVTADLSPRAVERANRFMDRAMTAPPPRMGKDGAEDVAGQMKLPEAKEGQNHDTNDV